MKIALVMPHDGIHRETGILKKPLRYASLTLTTLAALIPGELEAEVEIIDERVEALDPEALDADLAGITTTTVVAQRAYRISDRLRARGITTVLGGIHPTLLPDEAQPHADAVVVGYAEESWPRLLRDYSVRQMKERYEQRGELSLKGLPNPRRELLKKERYLTINTVQASRGCPHQCSFCVAPTAWKGYFHRPVEEVVEEIEHLEGNKVLFLDMNLMDDSDYSKALFRRMIPLHKQWAGLATIRIAEDTDLLRLA